MSSYTVDNTRPIPTRLAHNQIEWLRVQAFKQNCKRSDLIRKMLRDGGLPEPKGGNRHGKK